MRTRTKQMNITCDRCGYHGLFLSDENARDHNWARVVLTAAIVKPAADHAFEAVGADGKPSALVGGLLSMAEKAITTQQLIHTLGRLTRMIELAGDDESLLEKLRQGLMAQGFSDVLLKHAAQRIDALAEGGDN